MFLPYTQNELMDMNVQYRQKLLESLHTWLLRLWDMGMRNIIMSGSEMKTLAFLMTHPSLQQQLQSAHHTPENQVLLDCLTAAIRAVWPHQGDLTYLPTRWKTYAELQQVLQELGMKNIIRNMDPHSPSEELCTVGMRNSVLHKPLHLSLVP